MIISMLSDFTLYDISTYTFNEAEIDVILYLHVCETRYTNTIISISVYFIIIIIYFHLT